MGVPISKLPPGSPLLGDIVPFSTPDPSSKTGFKTYGTSFQQIQQFIGVGPTGPQGAPGIVNYADPTGHVELTPTNGTANTAMRSDAAPPLDQNISPSWTGQHTYTIGPIVPTQSLGDNSTKAASTAFATAVATAVATPATTSVTLTNGLNSNITAPTTNRITIAGPTGAFSIGGITGGVDGERMWVYNPLSQTMTIVNEDASSVAANRITTLAGGNIVTRPNAPSLVTMSYNGPTSRWIVESANGTILG